MDQVGEVVQANPKWPAIRAHGHLLQRKSRKWVGIVPSGFTWGQDGQSHPKWPAIPAHGHLPLHSYQRNNMDPIFAEMYSNGPKWTKWAKWSEPTSSGQLFQPMATCRIENHVNGLKLSQAGSYGAKMDVSSHPKWPQAARGGSDLK